LVSITLIITVQEELGGIVTVASYIVVDHPIVRFHHPSIDWLFTVFIFVHDTRVDCFPLTRVASRSNQSLIRVSSDIN
jgi:hypothetical protein